MLAKSPESKLRQAAPYSGLQLGRVLVARPRPTNRRSCESFSIFAKTNCRGCPSSLLFSCRKNWPPVSVFGGFRLFLAVLPQLLRFWGSMGLGGVLLGIPPSKPITLACLVSRDSESAYLLKSLIKVSPPLPPASLLPYLQCSPTGAPTASFCSGAPPEARVNGYPICARRRRGPLH